MKRKSYDERIQGVNCTHDCNKQISFREAVTSLSTALPLPLHCMHYFVNRYKETVALVQEVLRMSYFVFTRSLYHILEFYHITEYVLAKDRTGFAKCRFEIQHSQRHMKNKDCYGIRKRLVGNSKEARKKLFNLKI